VAACEWVRKEEQMPESAHQAATHRHDVPGVDQRRDLADASVRDLSFQLGLDLTRLARAEARLAVEEGKQRARRFAVGAGTFGAAGLLAFMGACCLIEALVLGLANVLRPWFAALIGAAVLFGMALFVVLPGWKGIRDRRPIRTDFAGSLRADVEAIRRIRPR
jgi:hypothetical protein